VAERKLSCIIGAGYAGLGAAKAYQDAGLSYDHVEASDRVGGNWALRIYDAARLISSRRTTGYRGYPMPSHYPTFPTRAQMLAYLEDYADDFGLRERIEFGTEVVACRPLDARGVNGWRVELASGEVREYSSVVAANGHFWDSKVPSYPGEFSGKALHSRDYRRLEDVEGPRVLVVGGGTSACDLVVDMAEAFGSADVSMRRGYWVMPKKFLGIPTSEFDNPWVPTSMQKPVAKAIVRLVNGRYERFGIDPPDHDIFDRDLTVSTRFVRALRQRSVTPRKEIARLDGRTVHFVDGTRGEYDTILWATGYRVSLPFLDDGLFTWEDGAPLLLAHMFPPGVAGLVVFGLINPHAGSGHLITDASDLMAEVLRVQARLDVPLPDLFARELEPTGPLMGKQEMYRAIRIVRRVTRRAARQPARDGRLAAISPSFARLRATR
jgi:hypothetical protein